MVPHVGVDKDAIADFTRCPLQRKHDQVAEPAERHRVLAGQQTVVGDEADIGAPVHGFGDQGRTQLSGGPGRDRFTEEVHIYMVAVSRSRALPFDYGVIGCDKELMRAFNALDLRFAAYTGYPFIATRR